MVRICARNGAALFAAIGAVACGGQSAIASVPFHGGPTYDASTRTGYIDPTLSFKPGSSAGNGIGVGYASQYAGGSRVGTFAVRWSASGWVRLGNLGLSSISSNFVHAHAINASGTTVGTTMKYEVPSGFEQGTRAVRWSASSTTAIELGSLGISGNRTRGAAYAINDSGTAVGTSSKIVNLVSYGDRAVRWIASGTAATELGSLGASSFDGYSSSAAYAINESGTAVGYALKFSDRSWLGARAVRWEASSTAAIELGNLGTSGFNNSTNNYAWAINSAGTAIGYAQKFTGGADRGTRAVRWDASTTAATELGNLGTLPNGFTNSEAYSINDAGIVVGFADKYINGTKRGTRAVCWDASGVKELDNLGTDTTNTTNCYAYDINNAGIIVGYAQKYATGILVEDRAVYWKPDGRIVDLNSFLSSSDAMNWTLNRAFGISNSGWITGFGSFDPDGATGPLAAYSRLFLMQVSVPCTSDFNDDGLVNDADFAIFATAYTYFSVPPANAKCDINSDGLVEDIDFVIFAQAYDAIQCP